MQKKKIVGLVVLLIGIVMFIFAMYAKGKIGSAKGMVNEASSYMSGSTAGKMAGGAMEAQTTKYDSLVAFCQYGGIILVIVGAGVMLCCCKKKHK